MSMSFDEFKVWFRKEVDVRFSDLSLGWRESFVTWALGGGSSDEMLEKCRELFACALEERRKRRIG